MKKTLIKSLKIISILILVLVIAYFGTYWYVLNLGKAKHTKQIEKVVETVQNGLDYPQNFSDLLDTVRRSQRSMKDIYHDKFWCMLSGNEKSINEGGYTYYSQAVYRILQKESKNYLIWSNIFDQDMVFAFGLEAKLSKKEIEAYYFLNKEINLKVGDGEYKRLKGLRAVSEAYHEKQITELNADELIDILVLMDDNGEFWQEHPDGFEMIKKIFTDYLKFRRTGER